MILRKPNTAEWLAIPLICLFMYTAQSKLMNLGDFQLKLGQSPFISHISKFVSWTIPLAELATAFLLTFNKTRLVGFYFAFGLMFLFTGYVFQMLHFSYFLPCSCGGVLEEMSWKQHLYFNACFTLLSVAGILITRAPSIPGLRPINAFFKPAQS